MCLIVVTVRKPTKEKNVIIFCKHLFYNFKINVCLKFILGLLKMIIVFVSDHNESHLSVTMYTVMT